MCFVIVKKEKREKASFLLLYLRVHQMFSILFQLTRSHFYEPAVGLPGR